MDINFTASRTIVRSPTGAAYPTSLPPRRSTASPRSPCLAAHPVEHEIESARLCLADHFDEILGMVINGDGAQPGQERMLTQGSRSIHFETCQPAKLQQCRPHPAARADDQDLITLFDPGHTMQHLIGRHVIQDQSRDLRRSEGGRHADEMLLAEIDHFGITAVARQSSHPVARRNP